MTRYQELPEVTWGEERRFVTEVMCSFLSVYVAAWDHVQTLPFKGQVLAETRLNDQRFQRKTMAWFEFLILAGFCRLFLRRQVI